LPVSFAISGKWHIAVTTAWAAGARATRVVAPELYRNDAGNAVYVLALPDDVQA
jgi:hypothetical protein